MSLSAKVCSVIKNGDWKSPRARNPVIQEIIESIPVDLKPCLHNEDRVKWTLTGTDEFSFKISVGGGLEILSDLL